MTIEQAIAILNPDHVERYDKIETVDKACKMGIEALKKQIPKKPIGKVDKMFGDISTVCPNCGSGAIINPFKHTHSGYCPDCGQALDWRVYNDN